MLFTGKWIIKSYQGNGISRKFIRMRGGIVVEDYKTA